MRRAELSAALSLALVFFLRMFGLFVLLPVLSLAASGLRGATPLLTGIAIGGYGLTQALLQVPMGGLSDHYGRKPTITAGLLVFLGGSVVAALSSSVWGVILGRVLQGAGAISAAAMALAADLTAETHRSLAMALIGVSIGLAFAAAFLLGPVLHHAFGLSGVFWTSAAMAAAALAVLHGWVPDPPRSRHHRDCEAAPRELAGVLKEPELLRLDAGVLCLHAAMTANFVAVPLALRDEAGLPSARHWQVYLPVLAVSVLLVAPALRRADRGGAQTRLLFLSAVALLAGAELALRWGHDSLPRLVLALVLFFTAFNFLEANLPALVSRVAPPGARGAALGAFATSQFLGAFLGGACGGWLYGRYGPGGVFLFGAALAALWLFLARRMRPPEPAVTYLLPLDEGAARDPETLARLRQVAGVRDAAICVEEQVAYLKVRPDLLDEAALRAFSAADR